jgi:hypothetical protein
LTVAGGPDLSGLRVAFEIKQNTIQAPSMASFRVYNPSPDSVSNLLRLAEGAKVTFDCGYDDHHGVVFAGDLKQVISGHETVTDTYVDLFCADGDKGYNLSTVSTTLKAGYTPADKLKAAVDAMGSNGVTMGMTNVDMSKPQFPRGIPLIGMARDVVREVALFLGATWSIQMGQVQVISKDKPLQGSALVMNSQTGLVGWPKQTADGIYVTSLINSQLQPNTLLQIDQSSIQRAEQDNNPLTSGGSDLNLSLKNQGVADGVYRVLAIDRRGDTRNNEWYDVSTCIGAITGSTPNSQIVLGRS